MRIGRQALAVHFLAEIENLLLGDAAFQKGAGVNAGRGMALDKHQIAAMRVARRAPEMHEADIIERGCGLEGGDMAAEFGGNLVGLEHDGGGVPADRGAYFCFDGAGARRLGLVGRMDGVAIGGVPGEGQLRAIFPRFRNHLAQDVIHPLHALKSLNRVQGFQPLAHFERGVVTVHGFLQIKDSIWSRPKLGAISVRFACFQLCQANLRHMDAFVK